jgi:hypothetical protein
VEDLSPAALSAARQAMARVKARHKFSKALCLVALHSIHTRALNFDNSCQAKRRVGGVPARHARV